MVEGYRKPTAHAPDEQDSRLEARPLHESCILSAGSGVVLQPKPPR